MSLRLRSLLLPSVLCLLTSFGALSAGPSGEPAMIWRVSDEDSHIYLLGSIHLLHPHDMPLREIYEVAQEQVYEVIVEADIENDHLFDVAIENHGFYDENGTRRLDHDFSAATISRLKGYLANEGYEYSPLLRGWVYLSFITSLEMDRWTDVTEGVDAAVLEGAHMRGQTISYLETIDFQVGILANEPQWAVEAQINAILDDPAYYFGGLSWMIERWLESDLEAIEAMLNPNTDGDLGNPYSLASRNANWMPTLRQHLEENRRTLAVVGAAHLPASYGLLALLEAEGFQLERLPELPWVDYRRPIAPGVLLTVQVEGAMGHDCQFEKTNDLNAAIWEPISTFRLSDQPVEFNLQSELGSSERVFFRFRLLE